MVPPPCLGTMCSLLVTRIGGPTQQPELPFHGIDSRTGFPSVCHSGGFPVRLASRLSPRPHPSTPQRCASALRGLTRPRAVAVLCVRVPASRFSPSQTLPQRSGLTRNVISTDRLL